MGIEQLIWAVLILIFIIVSAAKNLQKQKRRSAAKTAPTPGTPGKRPKTDDDLGRFLEELMGIEKPRPRPPVRREAEETPTPVAVKQPTKKPKQKQKQEIVKDEETMGIARPKDSRSELIQLECLTSPPPSEELKTIEQPTKPPKNNLKKAIILSEIIGPPRAKRKTHRLF